MRHHTIITLIAALILSATAVSAHDSSYYAESSLLATGKWVKVKVSHTGIQQITDSTLRSLGFDNPEKVGVYGYGGAMFRDDRFSTSLPDDLPRQMSAHTDGKLIFYGHAGEKITMSGMTANIAYNPYTFDGYYFLSDAHDSEYNTEPIPYKRNSRASETHIATYTENREIQSYESLGERWFDAMLESHSPTSYRFPIADADYSGTVRLGYAWVSEENDSITIAISPQVKVRTSNGLGISNPSSLVRRTGYTDFTFDQSQANTDSIHIDISLKNPRPSGSFAAMDHAAISFTRLNTLGSDPQRRMFASVQSGQNMRLVNIPDGALAWDVSSAESVRPYHIENSELTPASNTATIILFDPKAQLYVPEIVDDGLKNQNLHASSTPHMVIVTLGSLRPQAEQLAEIHRKEQGIDVLVADAEEIYNEYSSGAFSAMAIRRFVKMLYDRNPRKLRSLLLYGAGSQDMRHITHSMPILPVRECSQDTYMYSSSQSYCADSYFAMIADDYNPNTIWHQYPLIAVGRIPVHTPSQAIAVNNKIRRFMTTPYWQRSANSHIYIADNVDEGQYPEHLDTVAQEIASRQGDITIKNYIDFFPDDYKTASPQLNKSISRHVHEGLGFIHYIGHSAFKGFATGKYGISSHETFGWTNESMPIMILSTCNLGHFDGTKSTLGVESLLAPNSSIANIVYARESWARGNENAHTIIGRHIAGIKKSITLGELWLNIRNECIRYHMNSTRYSINDLNRNLLGDPELPLRFPEYNAAIRLADDSQSTEIAPLTPVRISGTICDTLGECIADFDGKAIIRVNLEDIPQVTRGIRDPKAKGATYICGSIPVATVAAEVAGGKYEATVIIPRQAAKNSIRITVYAESEDTSRAASGELEGLTVSAETNDGAEDTTSPDIIEFYAGNKENIVTSPDDMLYAVVGADLSGIAIGAVPLETTMHMWVDGKILDNVAVYCMPQTDGSAVISMPVGNLADGRHTATLSVSDNAGNRSLSDVTFEYVSTEMSASLKCLASVARDKAIFRIEHTYLSGTPEVTMLITDRNGKTVANAKVTAGVETWKWDLRDLSDKPVDDGSYTASILVTDGIRHTSSAPLTFTVLR